MNQEKSSASGRRPDRLAEALDMPAAVPHVEIEPALVQAPLGQHIRRQATSASADPRARNAAWQRSQKHWWWTPS